jgi:hypothetical protein
MMMRFAAVLAAIVLVGCSFTIVASGDDASAKVEACPITLRLTPGLTTEERDAVSAAVAMWNGVTVAAKQMCVSDGAGRDVRLIPDHGTEWHAMLSESEDGVAFIGLTRATDIVIVGGLSATTFLRVAAHEFGHVLGLQHVAGHTVMAPAALFMADDLTAADVAECRRVGACE